MSMKHFYNILTFYLLKYFVELIYVWTATEESSERHNKKIV